jgi:hypothetical protein
MRIVDETMFPYRSGTGPYAFRGALGKMFGMFGHWPVNYLENLRRGLQGTSAGTKAAFAVTWVGNSLALYGAFRAIGVNAPNYLPWYPLQFSGGPYWHLSHQLLQSLGPGYKGRQARGELFGLSTANGRLNFDPSKGELYKWFIPGGFMMKSFSRAVDHANDGNMWGAFLSATGAPVNPTWLERGF